MRIDALLFLHALVLKLEEEIPFAENIAQIVSRLARHLVTVGSQRHRHLTPQAGGKPNQAVGVPRQQVLIDPRLVVVTLDIGGGRELHQVAVAALVFAEQDEMVGAVGVGSAVKPAGRGHIDFTADDGLDVALLRRLIKLHRPEKVAVVRHRDGGHFQARGAVHELSDFTSAVKKTVVGMKVQMNKIFGSHSIGL